MTLGWITWEVGGSPSLVGVVAFIGFIPTICFSFFFGALTDRTDLIRASRIIHLLFFTFSFSLFGIWAAGLLSPLSICVIAMLIGTVNAAFNSVRMAMGPLLADLRFLSSIVALSSINLNVARMTGPALGGLAISAFGIGGALSVQAALFLPNFLTLAVLKLRRREGRGATKRSIFAEIVEGTVLARDNLIIRQALLLSAVYGFLARGVMDILPVISGGGFDRGAEGLALLASSAGAGAMMGGIQRVVFSQQSETGLPNAAFFTCFLGMGTVIAIGINPIWEISIGLVFILGFCSSVTAISIVTTLNLSIDDRLRGRIGSIWLTTAIGSAGIGALAMGAFSEWLGLATALSTAGVLGVFVTSLILVTARR